METAGAVCSLGGSGEVVAAVLTPLLRLSHDVSVAALAGGVILCISVRSTTKLRALLGSLAVAVPIALLTVAIPWYLGGLVASRPKGGIWGGVYLIAATLLVIVRFAVARSLFRWTLRNFDAWALVEQPEP